MERLEKLESETLKLLRSIPQIAKKPAQLWSTGKDSTLMLYLVKKAFGYFPFPVVHIDTGKKFDEIYKFRQDIALAWKLPLCVIKNEDAITLGVSPDSFMKFKCCTLLKTEALKMAIKQYNWDSLILSIRHDEHYARGMEDLLSLRNERGEWQYTARFGGFGVTAPHEQGLAHLRINALLPWREEEVWQYTQLHNIPINPLYFAHQYEDGKWYRYRSLGCKPCTQPLESKADTVDKIVSEIYLTPGMERSGRMQDKENIDTMLKLRSIGYM